MGRFPVFVARWVVEAGWGKLVDIEIRRPRLRENLLVNRYLQAWKSEKSGDSKK